MSVYDEPMYGHTIVRLISLQQLEQARIPAVLVKYAINEMLANIHPITEFATRAYIHEFTQDCLTLRIDF